MALQPFEDEYIIVSPSPSGEYDNTVLVTITSKSGSGYLSAGWDPSGEKYIYSGTGEISFPVIESGYISIDLFGIKTYSFHITIKSSPVSKSSEILHILSNGTQIIKDPENTIESYIVRKSRLTKIDSNKYIRLEDEI